MVFSGGFHGTPPLCTNGSAGYLMQLSVNIVILYYLLKRRDVWFANHLVQFGNGNPQRGGYQLLP